MSKNAKLYDPYEIYKMMLMMKIRCEECNSEPNFPDGWYFIPTEEAGGCPIICPDCLERNARKSNENTK